MLHTLSLTLQVVLHQGSLELLAELLEGWLVQQLIPFQFYPQGNILNNAGKEKGRERGRERDGRGEGRKRGRWEGKGGRGEAGRRKRKERGRGREKGGKGERIKCARRSWKATTQLHFCCLAALTDNSRLLSQSFRSCVGPSPSFSSFSLPSHHTGLISPLLSTIVSFQQSFAEIAHGHKGGIS